MTTSWKRTDHRSMDGHDPKCATFRALPILWTPTCRNTAKGCSPDNAAAEGFFGRMKTKSVYPEHWEERTRDEVLVLIDDYIRWYNHERIKQSLGWMSPVQYRQSQGMAA
ncbi:IS3 family transposase [Bifidobacterium adolescentis]